MHIDVVSDESIGRQARIYAEYRLFAALAPIAGARDLTGASLLLHRGRRSRLGERVVCAVAIASKAGEVARFTATGAHPYQAINRAVERVRRTPWPGDLARQASA